MNILVGKGTFKFTRSPSDVLYTLNLGACVAIGVVEADAGLCGMVQYVLPDSRGQEVPEEFPAFFADMGIPAFFEEFKRLGGDIVKAKIVVAGGGKFREGPKWLDIGTKNVGAARYFLKRLGVFALAERVGEPYPRRMEVSLEGGIKVYTFDQAEVW